MHTRDVVVRSNNTLLPLNVNTRSEEIYIVCVNINTSDRCYRKNHVGLNYTVFWNIDQIRYALRYVLCLLL